MIYIYRISFSRIKPNQNDLKPIKYGLFIINTDEEDTEVIYNTSYDICTNVLTRRGFKMGYFYKVENLQDQGLYSDHVNHVIRFNKLNNTWNLNALRSDSEVLNIFRKKPVRCLLIDGNTLICNHNYGSDKLINLIYEKLFIYQPTLVPFTTKVDDEYDISMIKKIISDTHTNNYMILLSSNIGHENLKTIFNSVNQSSYTPVYMIDKNCIIYKILRQHPDKFIYKEIG